MEFAQPQWLFLLTLVPLYGLWQWFRRRGTPGLTFSNLRAAHDAPRGPRVYAIVLPPLLRMGALALCVLALARPQVLISFSFWIPLQACEPKTFDQIDSRQLVK